MNPNMYLYGIVILLNNISTENTQTLPKWLTIVNKQNTNGKNK